MSASSGSLSELAAAAAPELEAKTKHTMSQTKSGYKQDLNGHMTFSSNDIYKYNKVQILIPTTG